ncbi:MAG TPA: SCO family protein [Vicinamibacterales bacterium]|nr:SCO family protein [Vicinamibacterales bacterium]
MRAPFVLSLCLVLFAAGCSKAPEQRTFTLQGQIQSLDPARKLVTVKHEEIKGFMPAMTMPYEVAEASAMNGLAAGDLIDAKLVVFSNGAHLTDIKKVGTAPLEKPPAEVPNPPTASSGFELLKPGEAVPDGKFLDQDGKATTFAAFKGSPVAMTFIYTRCPLPTFCPLMDRHFATLQTTLKADPALKNAKLVTVSFDPTTDTPAVLKKHAQSLDADLGRWTFLTGDRDDVDQFAARFGVSVSRALNDARDITHNLRTAVIGADGKLVKVYTGNDWSPDQILADLKKLE